MDQSGGKSEVKDAQELDELLKVQLEQSRVEWVKARERYRSIRSFAFVFLFIVIMGALLGLFFVLTRLSH